MKKSVIFDFDGVIADTRDMLFSIFSEVDPTISDEDFLAHFDGNVHEAPRVNFTPDSLDYMHREYCRRIRPYHIHSALEPLTRFASGYRMFIVSSGEEKAIKAVLEDVGVSNCFEAIYGHNTHKSKIAKFKKLRVQFRVPLAETLFITDTLGDIREAKKAGLRSIAVSFGFHDRERLMAGDPYEIVDTWDEIESVLSR